MNEEKWVKSAKKWALIILLAIPIIISSVYTAKEVTEIKSILTNINVKQGADAEAKNHEQYPLEENQENNPVENSTNAESSQQEEFYQESIQQSEIVYVTETGKCYHRKGCKHLNYSKIEIKKEEAEKSYRPCKDCYPELYN